jgi:hypothetical protein
MQAEIHTEESETGRMNIIRYAFRLGEAVECFVKKGKRFFYRVMLLGHACSKCNGNLIMIGEGLCQCEKCAHQFDPTVFFQRCSSCGGLPVLRVRRYVCKQCGSDINSRYLFEGLVFDRQYFREKIAESRQRKKEQRERVRKMLAESRSDTLMLEATDLDSVPGLVDVLNSLTKGLDKSVKLELKSQFDLNRYQDHVSKCLTSEPMDLREIPALIDNLKLDLIWRFIAIIFLHHYGQIDIQQQQEEIMVVKREAY